MAAPLAVCALLLFVAGVMTAQGLALAADGSYYLVRILDSGWAFGGLDSRALANIARDAPVVVVADAGVTDTHLLTLALGAGQLLLPATIWSAAILLGRTDPLVFTALALTASLCAVSTWLFNVSEAVLAAPLTALVAALLWQPRWRWPHAALAIAASLVLVSSYETSIVAGALFAGWGLWRWRRSVALPDRLGSLVVAALSVLSMLTPFIGFATRGRRGAGSVVYYAVSLDPRGLFVALCGAALLVGSMAGHGSFATRRALAIGGVLLLATGAAMLDITLSSSYHARGASALAAIALAALLLWQWAAGAQGRHEAPAWVLGVPVVFAAAGSGLLLMASTSWARSLDAFRDEVNRGQGVAVARAVLPPNRQQALWDWPEPSLSLIVRSRPSARILVAATPSFVPFPAEQARDQLDDAYLWSR
jgi:uncharacterized membrane protein YGL010W